MNKERPSLLLLRSVYDEAQKILETRRNHENEHPYAIVEGETVDEDGIKLGFLLANSFPEEVTTDIVENIFSLYGDVVSVTLDERLKKSPMDSFMRYFIVVFADDESVNEVIRCKDRLVIGKCTAKIYRMRKEPTKRFNNEF